MKYEVVLDHLPKAFGFYIYAANTGACLGAMVISIHQGFWPGVLLFGVYTAISAAAAEWFFPR